MLGERYIVKTVECPHCRARQKVHVDVRPETPVAHGETINCLKCKGHFEANVPNKIIRGPSPA
jgi:hypothetical protein